MVHVEDEELTWSLRIPSHVSLISMVNEEDSMTCKASACRVRNKATMRTDNGSVNQRAVDEDLTMKMKEVDVNGW